MTMKHEKFEKGSIIFKQGDKTNNKLYLILNGSALIFIKQDLDLGEE